MPNIRSVLPVLIILVIPLFLSRQTREAEVKLPLLNTPLLPVGRLGNDIPLTKALSYIGVYTQGNNTLFGIEVLLKQGKEPHVALDIPQDSTLRTALDQVVRQLPDYRYETASEHLINVFPLSAKQNPNDLLNIRVTSFDVKDQPVAMLITHPEMFVPELHARLSTLRNVPPRTHTLGPGLGSGDPKISLHLQNVTVREILNAVSVGTERFAEPYTPLGWVYTFEPDRSRYSWTFHWSVPKQRKQVEENSANGS